MSILPAVLGLIAATCFKIGKISFTDYKSVIISAIIFVSVYKLTLHAILAIPVTDGLVIFFYGVL